MSAFRPANTVFERGHQLRSLAAVSVGIALCAGPGEAAAPSMSGKACRADPRVPAAATAWAQRTPVQQLDFADVEAARCFQGAFLDRLRPQLGKLVGYKVGLFTKAGQERFGSPGPLLGRLYSKMLFRDGQTIRADYGVAPAWESDLLAVVGDASINTAKSREEIYRALRGIQPFIELTNGSYDPSVKVNALQLEALDVNARGGVVGKELRLARGEKGMADFLNLGIESSLQNGEAVAVDRARAPNSLGDLVDVVRFARDAVVEQGGQLKPGDVISLGVFTPAKPPKAGDSVKVTYSLGDRTGTVSAKFN